MKLVDTIRDTIVTSDCLDILPMLESKSVDYAFTSPPYNRKRNDKYSEYDDRVDDYFEFLCIVIDELLRICKHWVFFNIQATYYNREDVYKLIGKYSDKMQNIIIWNKKNPMPANAMNITNGYEFIFVLGEESLKSNFTYTQNFISTSVNNEMPEDHKAVMPLDVANWFVQMFTKPNETIIDPFCGTGTTGMACKMNGRHYIGIELIPKYVSIALSRIDGAKPIGEKKQIDIFDVLPDDNDRL